MRVLVLALLAACGGAPDSSEPAALARAASPIATSASASDSIVAQVNGRPVWASCVAAQGAKLGGNVKAALDECVAFELLAQEADRRGLATDPEVIDTTRTAIVNRLVEVGFEQKYTKPADLGDRLEKWFRDNAWRMHRPELRASTYLRATGPDAEAHAKAIYDKLAAQTGLFSKDLEALGALDRAKLEVAVVPDKARTQLDPAYADALFALPDVGRVSPPTKTPWGWDVILWTGGMPAKEMTREEMETLAFPDLRRSMFPIWVAQIERDLGVKPEIDREQLSRLDEVGP